MAYALLRREEILAVISKDFMPIPYYLKSSDISINELILIKCVAEDLCVDDVDFEEYSKYWINDYKLKKI